MTNQLAILQEINRNYQTRYESRYCDHCQHIRPHLIATAPVPETNDVCKRIECTVCHRGETRLI